MDFIMNFVMYLVICWRIDLMKVVFAFFFYLNNRER